MANLYYFWKRKIRLFLKWPNLNIRLIILLLGLGIFLLYCKGLRFCLHPEISLNNFNKAKNEITFLKSLLKRNNIAENEYLEESIPLIYIITPTYARPEQKAELTRLKNVFLHVPSLHWILVEDAAKPSALVSNFLKSSSLSYTHLFTETPPEWKLTQKEPKWHKPRGLLQRNKGINWLRENVKSETKGVVYFADDDNTYSIELFEEMRSTQKVSVWPVGLAGGVLVERPKIDNQGKVVDWLVGWRPDRLFATDMAGFAVNVSLLMNPDANFNPKSSIGFMETDFLEKLKLQMKDLEPKAEFCTKVLVWHTQTKEPKLKDEIRMNKKGLRTNENIEV